jgi:hypothetical protein
MLGALTAAWAPTPSWRQYLLPLLPPLFAWLALRLTQRPLRLRALWLVIGLFALAGLARPLRDLTGTVRNGSPILDAEQRAHAIAAALPRPDTVTTASIHAGLDSRHDLDPRLATGVFVLRNHSLLDAARAARFRVLTRETLFAQLDRRPPHAILTGIEQRDDMLGEPGDAELARYAAARGYRLQHLAGGVGELWTYPGTPAPP